IMHHIHHLLSILVSRWGLLGQQVLAMHSHCHPSCIQLVEQVFAAHRLLSGSTALATASTMTARAKGLLHRSWCPNKDKGVATHITRNKDRLADSTVFFRKGRVSSRKGTGGSLTVDTHALHLPIYFVLLHLSDVV